MKSQTQRERRRLTLVRGGETAARRAARRGPATEAGQRRHSGRTEAVLTGQVECPRKGTIAIGRCILNQHRDGCHVGCSRAIDAELFSFLARPAQAFGAIPAPAARRGSAWTAELAVIQRGHRWRRVRVYLERKGRPATLDELLAAGGYPDRNSALASMAYHTNEGKIVRLLGRHGELRFTLAVPPAGLVAANDDGEG